MHELLDELGRQPYGLSVSKVADAYEGAAADIEVGPTLLHRRNFFAGSTTVMCQRTCTVPPTLLQDLKYTGEAIFVKSQDSTKLSDVLFSRKIDQYVSLRRSRDVCGCVVHAIPVVCVRRVQRQGCTPAQSSRAKWRPIRHHRG